MSDETTALVAGLRAYAAELHQQAIALPPDELVGAVGLFRREREIRDLAQWIERREWERRT